MNNNKTLRLLGSVDDLNIVGQTLEDMCNEARLLGTEADKIGLQLNLNKTKVKELNNEIDPADSVRLAYEKVDNFKYLSKTINNINNWSKEIGIHLNKAKKTFCTLAKSLLFCQE